MSLTSEQEALIPVIRDEWLAHGLSTQPADRAAAEEGVRAAYLEVGLEPPREMVWLQSPIEGCLGAATLANGRYQVQDQVGEQVGDQVGEQVGEQVGDQVREQVREQVGEQVGDQVREQVREQVWAQVGEQVGDQVWEQVWDQVREQFGGQLGGQVWDQVQDQGGFQVVSSALWGQHDAAFMAWTDFWLRAGVIDIGSGLLAVARNAGWWWAFNDVAILTERPIALHRDAAGRLHNPSGLAVEYPDGWGVHALHGVRVPADLIEGEWGVDDVMREPNAEVRAAAMDHLGWDLFTNHPGFTLTATADDPGNPGRTLDLYTVPDELFDAPVRLLLCHNASPERDGTRRRYGITVPASITDPVAAAAWTFNLGPTEYRTLVRAT